MAKNLIFEPVGKLSLPVPSGTVSGQPVTVYDKIPGIALTDRGAGGNPSTHATVAINPSWVAELAVKGEDGAGNAAVVEGATLFRDTDGEINVDETNGEAVAIALRAVASGATTTIRALLLPPGAAA